MIRHFFLDKTNSIIKKSEQNIGMNPILQLSYGASIMKGLIHFDMSEIKKLIEDKTFANIDKITATLKMTNCFSVDTFAPDKQLIRGIDNTTIRASSFDLMLYKLPCHFDAGRGYDYNSDMWIENGRNNYKDGSNWYCCKTGILWNGDIKPYSLKDVNGDIYENNIIKEEYQKYIDGKDSIIIGTQHFDFGNENLSIDITKYVLDNLNTLNDNNYGLCLSFTPLYEELESEVNNYVGFFTDNTNTFFHPYIEIKYNEYIFDDRESFINGHNNKLYLYVSNDGIPTNLDVIPKCSIGETNVTVKQATKGVYYAVITPLESNVGDESICYDMWSEIALNGVKMDDVEMEFVSNNNSKKINIGNNSNYKHNVVPTFYGINDDESITIGEIREITIDFREKFSTDKKVLIDSAKYRLYVKDGNREYNVLDYQPIEKSFLNNFFIIYTSDLIPNQYYVDVEVKIGREIKYYREALRFKIISNITERYQ